MLTLLLGFCWFGFSLIRALILIAWCFVYALAVGCLFDLLFGCLFICLFLLVCFASLFDLSLCFAVGLGFIVSWFY